MSQEKQIDVEQVKALFEKRDLATPTATTYQPKFRDDVYSLGPAGSIPQQINPSYCLGLPSAMELMLILEDLQPVGYLDPPLIYTGGPFATSSDVPWIVFGQNGAVRNAGQVAQYWLNNSGDPGGHTAENRARQDIAWG